MIIFWLIFGAGFALWGVNGLTIEQNARIFLRVVCTLLIVLLVGNLIIYFAGNTLADMVPDQTQEYNVPGLSALLTSVVFILHSLQKRRFMHETGIQTIGRCAVIWLLCTLALAIPPRLATLVTSENVLPLVLIASFVGIPLAARALWWLYRGTI